MRGWSVLKNLGPDSFPKMDEGRYVGHHSRTGAILIMTEQGVRRARGFNKMPSTERWDPEGFSELKGTPWQLIPDASVQAPAVMLSGQDAVPAPLPPPPQHTPAPTQRKLYVLRSDVEMYGGTDMCPACTNLALGMNAPVPHTLECTESI